MTKRSIFPVVFFAILGAIMVIIMWSTGTCSDELYGALLAVNICCIVFSTITANNMGLKTVADV